MVELAQCFNAGAYLRAVRRIETDGYDTKTEDAIPSTDLYCDAESPDIAIYEGKYLLTGRATDVWIDKERVVHDTTQKKYLPIGVRVVLGESIAELSPSDSFKYSALRMYYECEASGGANSATCADNVKATQDAKAKELVKRADGIWTRIGEIVTAVRQEDEGSGGIDCKPAVDLYSKGLQEKNTIKDPIAYYAAAEGLLLKLFADESVRDTVKKHAMDLKCLLANEYNYKPYEDSCGSGYSERAHSYIQVMCEDIGVNNETLVREGGCYKNDPPQREHYGGWR